MKDTILRLKEYSLGTVFYSGYDASGISLDNDKISFTIQSDLTIHLGEFTGDIPTKGTAEELIKHFEI